MRLRSRHMVATTVLVLPALFAGCGGGGGEAPEKAAKEPSGGKAAMAKVDPATTGTLSGVVKFQNGVKKQKVNMGADPYCQAQHPGGAHAPTVVENDNGTLRWAFVYVKDGLGDYQFATPSDAVELDQKGCQYHPHVFGIQTSQPLTIKNSDSTLHNIHAKPKNNPEFNMAQPMQGMQSEKKFPKAEIMVPIKCDVHPWMATYAGVLPHPYYAVTGEDGSFEIPNLPPGDYTVEVWHEKFGTQTMDVTLEPKGSQELEFEYKAG